MSKRRRIVLWVCCGLLVVVVGALGALYWASQYVPEFYRRALEIDAQDPGQQRLSGEMHQGAMDLVSATKKKGSWRALFTVEQINAWLAVDMPRKHKEMLPPSFEAPRVAIEPEQMTVACRFRHGSFSSVLTLTVKPYLSAEEPNVLAVEICKARAGRLPLPLKSVLDEISAAAAHAKVQLRWRYVGGSPVAQITLPEPHESGSLVWIETLTLEDGKIYVAGRTE